MAQDDDVKGYWYEFFSAWSCLLNAVFGGPRRVTFSAWSWHLTLQGGKPSRAWGRARVMFVDALNFEPGHCQRAYVSHAARGLITH